MTAEHAFMLIYKDQLVKRGVVTETEQKAAAL